MRKSFLKLFLVVSALGGLALGLLVEGAKSGAAAALAAGVVLLVPALAGVVALGRIVVLSERQRDAR
jgi:hypothetical protein